ncbi:MAG: hypothetical protein ABIZ81_09775 [Opitutaceae bacterium]
MKPRAFALAFGSGWLALSGAAGEAPAVRPPSVAGEAIKAFKYHPAPPATIERAAVLKPATITDEPVMMSPYVVKALPDRTYLDVKAAMEQKARLKSPALWERGSIQILIPPKVETSHAGEPRFNLGIINLRF